MIKSGAGLGAGVMLGGGVILEHEAILTQEQRQHLPNDTSSSSPKPKL